MKIKNKLAILIVSVMILSFLTCCSNKDNEVKNIGILQLIQHEALDKSNSGFIEGLKEKGYLDGDNIKIEQQNANGKQDVANQIASQFASDKKDLIFAIATPSAQAAYNASKEIPIVFTAITDPVDAQIAKSLDSSGTNVTGTSDRVDVEEELKLLKQVVPDVKTLGFIYTTSEANSVSQLNELKSLAPKYNLTIKEIGIANINEINQNLTTDVDNIDALYAPTDNNVAASYALVGDICVKHNKPIIAAEPAAVSVGALICKGIDYYELGKMAGYKAAEVLDGIKPSEIKIEAMKDLKITVNTDVAKKLNITIPEEIEKNSTKVTGGIN
ncbi:MAG: ABC transporter substrate-binding protein [Clostridiaceae bacterium]|nr:ABC transporter substrate-binding protein [Clostridiaceae bacterium]